MLFRSTIVGTTYNTTTVSACDTYTWTNTNQAYTTSGSYTGSYNTATCVRQVLSLTIVKLNTSPTQVAVLYDPVYDPDAVYA